MKRSVRGRETLAQPNCVIESQIDRGARANSVSPEFLGDSAESVAQSSREPIDTLGVLPQ